MKTHAEFLEELKKNLKLKKKAIWGEYHYADLYAGGLEWGYGYILDEIEQFEAELKQVDDEDKA